MFNLVLKNLPSGQTSPLLLQSLVTTSISFKAHYFPSLCWTGHTSQTKSSDLVGHCIFPSRGSGHRGKKRISPAWSESEVWGEWQRQESKALSFSWVGAIRIWGSQIRTVICCWSQGRKMNREFNCSISFLKEKEGPKHYPVSLAAAVKCGSCL